MYPLPPYADLGLLARLVAGAHDLGVLPLQHIAGLGVDGRDLRAFGSPRKKQFWSYIEGADGLLKWKRPHRFLVHVLTQKGGVHCVFPAVRGQNKSLRLPPFFEKREGTHEALRVPQKNCVLNF